MKRMMMTGFLALFQTPAIATPSQVAGSAPALDLLATQFPTARQAFVDLPSGRTHYESVGAGPAVILVHGVSGPLQVWDKAVPALINAGYHVIRYDLYGRGFSDRFEGAAYDLPLYLRQLEELTAALGVADAAFVGSSFGAVIASEFALQHPEQTRGVALVGPAGFPINTPPLAQLGELPVVGDAMKKAFGKALIRKQNRKYAYDGPVFEEFWPYFDAQLDVPGTTEAMLATMKNAPVTKYLSGYEALGRAGIPVGVIWGRQDVTFPYTHHEDLLAAIPEANLVTIEKAAHLPQWERPEVTVPTLVEMLSRMTAVSEAKQRLALEAPVSTALDPELVDNAESFTGSFFDTFTPTTRSLELAPGVTKTYKFPTFYADVTTTAAVFPADYAEAAKLLPPGLRPRRIAPGKAAVAVSTYHYGRVRGMNPYNEVAIAIIVEADEEAPQAFVVAMPVTTLENRQRGHGFWGLPKEVREISLRQVGDDLVTMLPSLTLRIPMAGSPVEREQKVTLWSVLHGQLVSSVSRSRAVVNEASCTLAAFGLIPGEERTLTLGDGPEADLLRRLGVGPVPVRTSWARGLKSAFSLPGEAP